MVLLRFRRGLHSDTRFLETRDDLPLKELMDPICHSHGIMYEPDVVLYVAPNTTAPISAGTALLCCLNYCQCIHLHAEGALSAARRIISALPVTLALPITSSLSRPSIHLHALRAIPWSSHR